MNKFKEDMPFSSRLIRPGTWYIQGRTDSCATYLLIGEKQALVIDPGQHRNSVRKYIETITDLPLVVCNTHGHFDHTGADGQFGDCTIYMSKFACGECKKYFPRVNPDDYLFDYNPIAVCDGFVIDIGNRQIEAIAVGCHSAGSLAWLDKKYKILFSGDELESGQVLIWGNRPGNACVEKYYDNLTKLKKHEVQGEIDLICPGHNGTPVDAGMIDIFMENCERVMEGIEGKKDISSPTWLGEFDPREPEMKAKILSDPTIRRSEWKGSSLVYSNNRIFYRDLEE